MSVVAAPGSESKSFEVRILLKTCRNIELGTVIPQELRIDDYIKAYRSTGRPPQPFPQEPADELQRKSLNLPPLFKPHPIRNPTSVSTASSLFPFGALNSGRMDNPTEVQLDLAVRIDNPAELPTGQEFRLPLVNGEKYHSITCMPEYTNFTQEVRFLFRNACNLRHFNHPCVWSFIIIRN